MTTNITEKHKYDFDFIQTHGNPVALVSCFCDGEPTAAICSINTRGQAGGSDEYVIVTPLFVAVTKKMKLADHDGVFAQEQGVELDVEPKTD